MNGRFVGIRFSTRERKGGVKKPVFEYHFVFENRQIDANMDRHSLYGGAIMTSQHLLKASLLLVAGLLPFVGVPSLVRADATGPSAYDYREEPGIPVQVSGFIKQIKEVAVHDT